MSIVPLSPTDRCRSVDRSVDCSVITYGQMSQCTNIPGPKVGVKDVAKQTSHQEYVLRYDASDAYNAYNAHMSQCTNIKVLKLG